MRQKDRTEITETQLSKNKQQSQQSLNLTKTRGGSHQNGQKKTDMEVE